VGFHCNSALLQSPNPVVMYGRGPSFSYRTRGSTLVSAVASQSPDMHGAAMWNSEALLLCHTVMQNLKQSRPANNTSAPILTWSCRTHIRLTHVSQYLIFHAPCRAQSYKAILLYTCSCRNAGKSNIEKWCHHCILCIEETLSMDEGQYLGSCSRRSWWPKLGSVHHSTLKSFKSVNFSPSENGHTYPQYNIAVRSSANARHSEHLDSNCKLTDGCWP